MDNDNKIGSRKQEVLLFLKDELAPISHKTSTGGYDLETEYAKTRENRSVFIPLVLIGCFVVVGLGAFITVHQIKNADREIAVDINVFDDLNRSSIADTFTRAQENYDDAVQKRNSLKGDYDADVAEVKAKYGSDMFVVDSMKLEKNAYKVRAQKIYDAYTASLKSVHTKYDAQLASADKQIADCKAKLDEFDKSKIQEMENADSAADSERKLQQLEKQNMEQEYQKRIAELRQSIDTMRSDNLKDKKNAVSEVANKYQAEIDRLDPVIKDSSALAIIKTVSGENTSLYNSASCIGSVSDAALGPELSTALKDAQNAYNSYEYLHKTVASIPQKHSIPSYVAAESILVHQTGVSVASAAAKRAGVLHNENVQLQNDKTRLESENESLKNAKAQLEIKNGRLSSDNSAYDTVLAQLASASGANAFVMKASASVVTVYVAPSARYLIGTKGVNAQIKTALKTVNGMITAKDGAFVFTAVQAENQPAEDLSTAVPGSVVVISGDAK